MSTHRQPIHSIHNKKFWTEFFYLYESLPALWDMNNPLYKNRQVKCDAYDVMVEKLREIEPNADREDVLRKINIFRTNYRRECTRINMSLQEGRHYQSTLWYFDLLSFLQTPDMRRDRKRKLDDDGEKSIMRKRRINNMVAKSSNQFIITTMKKDQLIEYQPHSTNNFEYDLEEEQAFDYVPDELTQAFVEGKSDSTTEIQQNTLSINSYHHQNVDVEGDEDDQSQQEYGRHQEEFENYTLKRSMQANNKKLKLTTDNITQLSGEIITTENPIEINDESQDQKVFHDYTGDNENESIQAAAQWSIKTTNAHNIATLQLQKPTCSSSSNNIVKVNETKFVRDVKTMTNNNPQNCKLSESSEILAKSWAVQYDELTSDQKLLARKAINDILFEACMGHLTIGNDGRVNIDGGAYKNLKTKNVIENEEVESSEIYEQSSMAVASSSSLSTSAMGGAPGTTVTITTNVDTTPKVQTNEEWLKL